MRSPGTAPTAGRAENAGRTANARYRVGGKAAAGSIVLISCYGFDAFDNDAVLIRGLQEVRG